MLIDQKYFPVLHKTISETKKVKLFNKKIPAPKKITQLK